MLLYSILCISILLNLLFIARWLNKKMYKSAKIWNISLFILDVDDNIETFDFSIPYKIFSPRNKIRLKYHQNTGYADPFLFVKDNYLYLFYEYEIFDDLLDSCKHKSPICCYRTKDLKKWENIGCVLEEDIHLSYPFVFEYNGDIFMMPETKSNHSVTIYKAHNFPFDWIKEKDLLKNGEYVDSCLMSFDDKWQLFTTIWNSGKNDGLYIYESDCLSGDYKLLTKIPISTTKENMRCGGSIINVNGNIYRPAQFCKNYYGENLALYKVNNLNTNYYSERFVKFMNSRSYKWSKFGGHHFNTCEFNGKRIVVMDGRINDNIINNRTRYFFRFIHRF